MTKPSDALRIETAQALEVSPSTVKREWTVPRAWLYRELERT
ncbi:MAG: ECF-type sigma factor [Planctomycetota bacterium]